MVVTKPALPRVTVADLGNAAKRIHDLLEAATVSNPVGEETVDMEALAKRVATSNDRVLENAYDVMVLTFARHWAGDPVTGRRPVPPRTLDAQQRRTLLSALAGAQDLLTRKADSDGVLEPNEHGIYWEPGFGLPDRLASAIAYPRFEDYQQKLRSWGEEVRRTVSAAEARRAVSDEISAFAFRAAATRQGAEAIKAALLLAVIDEETRENFLAASDVTFLSNDCGRPFWIERNGVLDRAEASLLRNVPFLGGAAHLRGHLSDREIRHYFAAESLPAFTAEKIAEIEQRVGSLDAYLDGCDLGTENPPTTCAERVAPKPLPPM